MPPPGFDGLPGAARREGEAVILNASKVGFAFPLQADQFTVVRFSLDGVAKASQLAERLALEARKSNSGGTRNVTL